MKFKIENLIAPTMYIIIIGLISLLIVLHNDWTPTRQAAKKYFNSLKYRQSIKFDDKFRGIVNCRLIEKVHRPLQKYKLVGRCKVDTIDLREILEIVYLLTPDDLLANEKLNKR